jgi:hypothetical protein
MVLSPLRKPQDRQQSDQRVDDRHAAQRGDPMRVPEQHDHEQRGRKEGEGEAHRRDHDEGEILRRPGARLLEFDRGELEASLPEPEQRRGEIRRRALEAAPDARRRAVGHCRIATGDSS